MASLVSRWRAFRARRKNAKDAKSAALNFLSKGSRYVLIRRSLVDLANEESDRLHGIVKRRKYSSFARKNRKGLSPTLPSEVFLRRKLFSLQRRADIGIRRLRKQSMSSLKFRLAVLTESLVESHLYFGLTAQNEKDIPAIKNLMNLLPHLKLSFRPRLFMSETDIRSPTPAQKDELFNQLLPALSPRLTRKEIHAFVDVFYQMYTLICRGLLMKK